MNIYHFLRRLYSLFEQKKKEKYLDNLKNNGLKLGENVEIISNYFFDPSHCFLISIGDNCTICPNVRLIAHDASTFKILGYTKIGKINIMENCFIGDSTIILPNVTIGANSIIGSGSIVTQNVPPNMIAAGNPAKVIMSVENYMDKIKQISKNKKVFGEEYFIQNLDEVKRKEIIDSVKDSIGFII
ncbi:MAG: acyltransferase [Gammaproteobacteria bacterium]|nr:acyltransferase [Gammaproteobacteria bacterium]